MVYIFFFIVMIAIVAFAVSVLTAFVNPVAAIPAVIAVAVGWWAAGKADSYVTC